MNAAYACRVQGLKPSIGGEPRCMFTTWLRGAESITGVTCRAGFVKAAVRRPRHNAAGRSVGWREGGAA